MGYMILSKKIMLTLQLSMHWLAENLEFKIKI